MEKSLAHGSYWLGVACSLVAFVWKGLEVLNVAPEGFGSVRYMTFYKGGLLFLLIAIAAAACVWLKSQKA